MRDVPNVVVNILYDERATLYSSILYKVCMEVTWNDKHHMVCGLICNGCVALGQCMTLYVTFASHCTSSYLIDSYCEGILEL